MEKTPLSQGESYTPGPFSRFLWWLSTAEPEIIKDSVVDRNRYRIIGMTVLTTWIFATLAWTYFFSTVTTGWIATVFPGLFMGFIILAIDRALIKGITSSNKRRLMPLMFRGILALTIGTFMAQPAILYLFSREINVQASLDNEKKKQEKRASLDSLYGQRKNELLQRHNAIEQEARKLLTEVNISRDAYIAETDGSGGTGKIGIKDIALAKKNEFNKLEANYDRFMQATRPQLDSLLSEIGNIEKEKVAAEKEFATSLQAGFLSRIEALNNLLKGHPALQYRYYLILAILVLIELMPVIAKTLLPSGSYEEKARLREDLEKEAAATNADRERELKEFYGSLALRSDRETIEALFGLTAEQRKQKLSQLAAGWKSDQDTFDSLWEKIKKEMLSRQEN